MKITKITTKGKTKLERRVTKKFNQRSREHWNNLQTVMKKQLTSGVSGVSGGVRHIKVPTPTGPTVVTTPYWKQLTEAYVNRHPKSTHIWRKHYGTGGANFHALVPIAMATTSVSETKPVIEPKKGGTQLRMSWQFKIKQLPSPLDKYITDSYGEAKQVRTGRSLKGRGLSGLSKIEYVEEKRPFLSKISAKLGVEWRKDLNSLKKKL